jgi:hypothetical protein
MKIRLVIDDLSPRDIYMSLSQICKYTSNGYVIFF